MPRDRDGRGAPARHGDVGDRMRRQDGRRGADIPQGDVMDLWLRDEWPGDYVDGQGSWHEGGDPRGSRKARQARPGRGGDAPHGDRRDGQGPGDGHSMRRAGALVEADPQPRPPRGPDGRARLQDPGSLTEEEQEWASRWSTLAPPDPQPRRPVGRQDPYGQEGLRDAYDDLDDMRPDALPAREDGHVGDWQQMPSDNLTRAMANTFVDRFRHGGTVGRRTKTKRIMTMLAVPEADIPQIKRRLRRGNLVYDAIMVLLSIVILGVSAYLGRYYMSLWQNDAQMSDITAEFTKPVATPEPQPDMPAIEETDMPPLIDFEGLRGINDEVSGWLRIPGTTVDYPVITTPVESKYLRMDIYGDYSVPGMLFTDWTNTPALTEEHIVIYGHHLPWPAMFHDVSLYLEEEGFFDSHRIIYFETPETTYVLKAIGVHKAQPDETEARQTMFANSMEFQRYVDDRIAANVTIDPKDYNRKGIDKLFTLITCTDNGTARCIVNATVIEEYPTAYVPVVRARMQGKTAPQVEAEMMAQREQQAAEQAAAAQQHEQEATAQRQAEGEQAAEGETTEGE